jgi:hypothetical protein
MGPDSLLCNGITGEYLLPPLTHTGNSATGKRDPKHALEVRQRTEVRRP